MSDTPGPAARIRQMVDDAEADGEIKRPVGEGDGSYRGASYAHIRPVAVQFRSGEHGLGGLDGLYETDTDRQVPRPAPRTAPSIESVSNRGQQLIGDDIEILGPGDLDGGIREPVKALPLRAERPDDFLVQVGAHNVERSD